MTSMSSSGSEFREDDSGASESFWFDFEASRIHSDHDDETVDNTSNKRRQTSDSTNVHEEEATCSAPLTTVDTNRNGKRTRRRHFKAGDTVDMDDPKAVARMNMREEKDDSEQNQPTYWERT
ncbi:hypothetical protein I350_03894 [Cryptococcus amylolentus CBS 6273]|uniref:Uncharacterized protein n=1 Tax=Cryptococcus amylolentus CBS 6273 TaxID=1296118 RepID=A0A1E3K0E1_9TREE|nr:hypothetical protein I350_03894 [Cryptococcus amylolentus CBS 6273]